jgi:hypothetical protein
MIAVLIIASFVLAALWGIVSNIVYDRKLRMNSWLGVVEMLLGVAAVMTIALLGCVVLVQPTWEIAEYVPLGRESARYAHFVVVMNTVAWAGPQVTGIALILFAWWAWKKLIRAHYLYVRDTRFRKPRPGR